MSPSLRLLAAAVVMALAAACAKAPPRTAPAPAPPLAARSLAALAGLAAPPRPVPVSALVVEAAPVEEAPRPAPAPPERPAPVEPPARPPARLGTPETADAEAMTRQVNETLARAREALATVRPERLSADARVQYQTARQLIEQADAAVKGRNFLYAIRLADKAETLARRLAGGDGFDGRPV